MARLPRSGSSFSSLYESEITLEDVISNLELRPLSKKDEAYIRTTIGSAIGQWAKIEGVHKEAGARLDIKDFRRSLKRFASGLEEISSTLAPTSAGLHQIHDIEVVGKIALTLSETTDVGSVEQANNFLERFRSGAEMLARTVRVAEQNLTTIKTRHGRIRLDWHDDFTRAVALLCDLNSIPKTIITDPVSRHVRGKFLDTASALQRLLDPRMRAPSARALADRLEKSKKRIGFGKSITRKNPPA